MIDAVDWLKEKYAERGFIVFACHKPKDIGEIMDPEDEFLSPGVMWRVTAESTASDMIPQLMMDDEECRESAKVALQRPFFYRVEAMD